MNSPLKLDPFKLQKAICKAPLRPTEKAVLLALIIHFGNPKSRPNDWFCAWPSLETIKLYSGVKSISHISRILKKLQNEGYLTIYKRDTKNGYRKPNLYDMNVTFLYQVADSSVTKKANGNLLNKQMPLANKANKDTNTKKQSLKKEIPVEESSNALISTLQAQHTSTTENTKEGEKKTDIDQLSKYEEDYLITCCGYNPNADPIIKENEDEYRRRQLHAFRIVQQYYKVDPSQKVITGFWWALIRVFHPKQYKPSTKLTKHQYQALKSLFSAWGDHAFHVIAVSVADWEISKKYAVEAGAWKNEIPKTGPTPIIFSKYDSGFLNYWSKNYLKMSTGETMADKELALLATYKMPVKTYVNCSLNSAAHGEVTI